MKMGLYLLGEWMGFDLVCVKPRAGETSKGTAQTPGSGGPLVTGQRVLQNQTLFYFWKSVEVQRLHSSKAEVTHRQDKYPNKSWWCPGGVFQQYETTGLKFMNCFPLNTLTLKPVNDFLNANFLIVLTG